MKVAYFDCFSGISGDMIIGSLIHLGLEIDRLKEELNKLNLTGYDIEAKKVLKNGISAVKFNVNLNGHEHHHRNLDDLNEIIDNSSLDADIKEKSKKCFFLVATAEAKIHNKDISEIHFHELGAVDFIIDVAGVFIGLKELAIEQVYASRISVGTGFITCAHGKFPVPAPATLELLEGIPVRATDIEAELVTPTGACLIKSICRSFDDNPDMQIEKTGYGAGERELEQPNLLRVLLGSAVEESAGRDEVLLIETNIDNMSHEILAFTMERLFKAGALDVYFTPIYMKKNRPAIKLSVLVNPGDKDIIADIIFKETYTYGLRFTPMKREKISRQKSKIETEYGTIGVNIGKKQGRTISVVPEYEDCRAAALEKDVPVKKIYEEVKKMMADIDR